MYVRRLASGRWRLEYTLRTRLHRLWLQGQCANVLFEPKIGRIDELEVSFEHQRLLAGSLEHGMVAICDPVTGKVNRDYIYATEDQQELQISSVKITS